MIDSPPKMIIIVGPTAVGKTSAAIKVAQHYHTEIISADSRQCFQEMKIGVARPTLTELNAVPHHYIASHSIHEPMNAILFEQYALDKANELFQKHNIVVMVGGTGLYIKAFCEGMDPIPDVNPSIRQNLIENYEAKGFDWLYNEVKEKDPLFIETGEAQNPQRLMRALEVILGTGQSIQSYKQNGKKQRPFTIEKYGLELPRTELVERINLRVDQMMEEGLLEEAKKLIPFKDLTPLQTVGYSELFDYFDGKTSLDEAVELIKVHTRQYAKRQMTWFKKDKNVGWLHPREISSIWKKIKI